MEFEFLALPDHPAAAALALPHSEGPGVRVLPHASGRPWLVGRWDDGDMVEASAGADRLVLLGPSLVGSLDPARLLAQARTPRDLDALARAVPGAYHLLAVVGGRVRVQGTLSGARQVFHARIGPVTLAADRPQSLAALAGTGIREDALPLRLLAPSRPWPLNERCPWQDVHGLEMGHYLELATDGTATTPRWWTPPEPDLTLAEGSALLREALTDAVAARTAGPGFVSADLSGGMDSTSLCFLAARRAGPLLTLRQEAEDPSDDDRVWGRRAEAVLADREHLVLSRGEMPLWFADLGERDPDVEGPYEWTRTRAQIAATIRRVAEHGSVRHLTGDGGDELFFTTPNYLHTLVRTHPGQALRHLRGIRAMTRWTWPAIVRGLWPRQGFDDWLGATPPALRAPVAGLAGGCDFGWGAALRMPPWATPQAVDAVSALLAEAAARRPEPLSPVRAQHSSLQDVRLCGETVRRTDRMARRLGVSWHAPYLDDRVIEAALSVRLVDRATPYRYKPVLSTAMRGVVPDDILDRPTKAEFSAEAYAGLRRHREQLLAVCEDLRLADVGLVDAAALRAAVVGLHSSSLTLIPLDGTLATETWLRSLATEPAARTAPAATAEPSPGLAAPGPSPGPAAPGPSPGLAAPGPSPGLAAPGPSPGPAAPGPAAPDLVSRTTALTGGHR